MQTVSKLFRWGHHYSIGIDEVDRQHEELAGLLNELNAAHRAGVSHEVVTERLATLITAAAEHFRTEEQLMQDNHYPSAERHQREHERLAAQVLEFQADFESGRAQLTDSMMTFLKDWLRDHMLISDRQMGDFLRTKLRP